MKRFFVSLVVLMMIAGISLAKGPQDVIKGRHNFSSVQNWDILWPGSGGAHINYYASDDEEEVCIFCHTPHGGSLAGPLWNRTMPTQTFTHYTSSSLLPEVAGLSPTRPVNNESLMCLSCHDGSIAVNSILNYSNDLGAVPSGPIAGWGVETVINAPPVNQPGPRIGDRMDPNPLSEVTLGSANDLSDDHPISFNYKPVSVNNNTLLRTVAQAIASDIVFYPRGTASDGSSTTYRVECPTCHDPHVNYIPEVGGNASYTPFLIRPNEGSNLCLACHIK